MPRSTFALTTMLCFAFAGPAAAGTADGAGAACSRGDALLAKADFAGALAAYGEALVAEPANLTYRTSYAMVRRVLELRRMIEREEDPQRWELLARSLRTFYASRDLHREAMPLDARRYERAPTPEAATLLAETQIELGLNAEAQAVLAAIPRDRLPPAGRILGGLALARQGKVAEAKAVASEGLPAAGCAGAVCLLAARLHASVGSSDAANALLVRAFESTPAGQLEALKQRVTSCKDLAPLAGTPAFAAALKTTSKVQAAAGCAAGASCAACPLSAGASCQGGTQQAAAGCPSAGASCAGCPAAGGATACPSGTGSTASPAKE
jgi:tetratricopeptide (TPR) repeat protein